MRRLILVVFVCFLMGPSLVHAQNMTAPAPHWGALLQPDSEPQQQLSFQVFGLTEFGPPKKDEAPEDAGLYARGLDRTIGFNVLSFSNTRPLRINQTHSTNTLYSSTLSLGVIHDLFTEWLQNDVIHDASNGLRRVPREEKAEGFLLGYEGQLNHFFSSVVLPKNGDSLAFVQSPVFVGSGFGINSFYSDMYVHTGVSKFDLRHHFLTSAVDPFFYISVSSMVRAGVVLPYDFGGVFPGLRNEEVVNGYYLAQGTVEAHLFSKWYHNLSVSFSLTHNSGLFSDTRNDELLYDGFCRNDCAPRKYPIREFFYSARAEIGDFSFEVYNDSPGNKDSGPSFGARLMYRLGVDSVVSKYFVSYL